MNHNLQFTDDRIAALLHEDAALKRRREEIKAELETLGEEAKDRWYAQEYERELAMNARKAERLRQLRRREEERQRTINGRRARMTPEARAHWEGLIAGVKECTKEELREEARLAQIKKKQDRAASRRWKNGNGAETYD
jgi:hypothetical protein